MSCQVMKVGVGLYGISLPVMEERDYGDGLKERERGYKLTRAFIAIQQASKSSYLSWIMSKTLAIVAPLSAGCDNVRF